MMQQGDLCIDARKDLVAYASMLANLYVDLANLQMAAGPLKSLDCHGMDPRTPVEAADLILIPRAHDHYARVRWAPG